MLPYVMLCISVCFEVFADVMMKLSDGFKQKLPVIGVVIGYAVSFWLMSQVLMHLPLGPVYAAWTGLSIVVTAVVGAILWNEGFNLKKTLGLIAIIVGVVMLKLRV
ncbi:MAG: multidrug efflux SMR transporter [Coriobacteriia bacterium]|nr:multidrug efflux SMR transporter [Coriobacteriia bacterium]